MSEPSTSSGSSGAARRRFSAPDAGNSQPEDEVRGRGGHRVLGDGADGDWLARCEGFTVVAPDGRIGTVDEIRYGPSRRWDSPSELVVHAGRAGRRLLIVPVDDIADVDPELRVVTLHTAPHIVSTETGSAA